MNELKLEIAKERFYNFLVGAAGLRFKSRKDFDEVVEAIVKAARIGNCPYCHDQYLESRKVLDRILARKYAYKRAADGAECVCENHTDNDGWRCNVCGLLSPHRR